MFSLEAEKNMPQFKCKQLSGWRKILFLVGNICYTNI